MRKLGYFAKPKRGPRAKSFGNTDLGYFVTSCVMEYVTNSVEQTPCCYANTGTDCGVFSWPSQWFALGKVDRPLPVTSNRCIRVKNNGLSSVAFCSVRWYTYFCSVLCGFESRTGSGVLEKNSCLCRVPNPAWSVHRLRCAGVRLTDAWTISLFGRKWWCMSCAQNSWSFSGVTVRW